ncbi:MAG TPA: ring-cleaving dioxygenase [Egibacteraceae bacterium]|nr:ring-cleaving dioxygenase [Egibacteraceae bacterium]
MTAEPLGIHHVTAVASNPQANVDFYLSVLGLRLVKTTVNFDAPDTYHLYYGDEVGHPGTILTFFPWPNAPRGRHGTGQTSTVSFSVPQASLGYWKDRLAKRGVEVTAAFTRMDEDVVVFTDPDGLQIELVAHTGTDERPPWERGPVPGEHAIRGLYAVTMAEEGYEATADLLTETLGFRHVAEEANRFRFDVGSGGPGARVDVICQPDAPRGMVAAGTVHHVAWRAPDGDTQVTWRQAIVEDGLNVTPVLDRQYFTSIYFREPGGVLLEIATDPPGFTVDEDPEHLGSSLKLPPWLEGERDQIEQALPPLKIPD